MKVLILGGTGAIGVPVVDMLAERDVDVYVTSRRSIKSNKAKVHYIQGNAHDLQFVKSLLETEEYDAIVDFMIYTVEEFQNRYLFFLKNTKQYLFFSSARVYANSEERITEKSPRLLDVTEDCDYIATKEYALEKARQEDCLINSEHGNWTIIRPYITYNNERLQLGVLEKEHWLYRALKGKTIVFSEDIASKYTTLTFGSDVARRVVDIVGLKQALGQIYQITTDESIMWRDVLNIYVSVIEKITGEKVKVHMQSNSMNIAKVLKNKYQIVYDRRYDRRFDSKKINSTICKCEQYVAISEGLECCISSFLNSNRRFLGVSWALQAYFDKVTKETTSLKEIPGIKNKIKYLLVRYTPYLKLVK